MTTKSGIHGGVAMIVFIAATVLTQGTGMASTPSSPAEQAATAELNRTVTSQNTAADDQAKMQEVQYQELKRQYEAQQQEYQARLQHEQDNRAR